ncbi:trypsin-like peptidase [Micromonospora kangleipakensis]|uniref:Trypsin-like peptidase n=1 Tax=Micromonospora kangleipakensis TaxID=1077942 RepID=A0A4Q8BB10_9ACTN|nr:serine protease [Micromonospora kangleipakensis]RZU74982.1 trypsin-like peptidase [Micromonospora kangleipakensis]
MDQLVQLRREQVRQCAAASQRFEQYRSARAANLEKQEAGKRLVGTQEQLEARAGRLIRTGEVQVGAMLDAARTELSRPLLLERIIGESKDLQASSFLARGARAAASVARISIRDDGRELPLGTGFLVSPRLLLTNNHVLPDPAVARQVVIEFGAEMSVENLPLVPLRYDLDPDGLFVTDVELDFTLVLVSPGADRQPPGVVFGWNRLVAQLGKILVGEAVNIVGHPMGRKKEIAIRNNRLEVELTKFLHYSTDTEPGNSGSPVFNDQWEVVALHHCGVPRTDDQGRVLRRSGALWSEGDGDDAIDWMANEGARVSVIVKHLASLDPDAQHRTLLAEMGPEAGLGGGPIVVAPAAAVPVCAGPSVDLEAAVVRRGVPARPGALGGNHLLFLHGRGQEGHDPGAMRRSWTAALNHGLTLAGLHTIDPVDVWFPFYGDRFMETVRTTESAFVSIEALSAQPAATLAPAAPSTRILYETLVAEAAACAGMPDVDVLAPEGRFSHLVGLVVSKLQRQLSWVAARSGLDTFVIAQILRDVAAYLDNERVRRAVLDAVRETLPASGRLVIVSHSLGTVVAMDLIHELAPNLDVALLVTAGSPLGIDSVYNRLLLCGPNRPERIARWLNTWCPADAVAIGCPLHDDWRGQLDEIAVDNPKERAHNITDYLTHHPVARAVAEALKLS